MRWNRLYDCKRESLRPDFRRPHTAHQNAHTEQEIKWIKVYRRRNPNISGLYGKLREDKAYSHHTGSLCRVFASLGFRKKVESTKKKSRHPANITRPQKSAIRSSPTSNMFRQPVIRADIGGGFMSFIKSDRAHIPDRFCRQYGIEHRLIRPRTPRHNGKVERSRREGHNKFYSCHSSSCDDLNRQLKYHLAWSDNRPMRPLVRLSPVEFLSDYRVKNH